MPSDIDVLMEMGFSQKRAEKALALTNNSGVAAATEWLFAHENDPDVDDDTAAAEVNLPSGPVTEGSDDAMTEGQQQVPLQAKSLKCDDCGKLLKSENEVQLHATRSGHANFSESVEEVKPLTEEEKKAQLAKVQELMKQKRLEREEKEKQEQLQREKQRRVHGKELTNVKQKMHDDEMKKIMEERRREKEEEKQARQRVREQIAKDKEDRAVKFGTGTAAAGASTDTATKTSTMPQPSPATTTTQPKEYTETNIQIRLFTGEAVTQKFSVREPLAAVRFFAHGKIAGGQLGDDIGALTFATAFPPRRVFSEDEMMMPLGDLGLIPSATLIATKAKRTDSQL